MARPTTHPDRYEYDPFEGDELLSEAPDDRPEPTPAEQRRIIAAAQADMAVHLAKLQRVLNPEGPRQIKRRQRAALFEVLRSGVSRSAACERAGVSLATFDQWMQSRSFAASVDRAEQQANNVLTTDDVRRW